MVDNFFMAGRNSSVIVPDWSRSSFFTHVERIPGESAPSLMASGFIWIDSSSYFSRILNSLGWFVICRRPSYKAAKSWMPSGLEWVVTHSLHDPFRGHSVWFFIRFWPLLFAPDSCGWSDHFLMISCLTCLVPSSSLLLPGSEMISDSRSSSWPSDDSFKILCCN